MRLAARSTVIAGFLSIAAILAPAASALPNLEPATTAQGQPTISSPVVRPNPHQQTSQRTTVGPPVLRVARGSELAAIKRAEVQREAALSYRPPAGARYSSAGTAASAAVASPVAASSSPVKAPSAGFDYGAAAVGAGLAVAMMVLISAGGLAVRRRRHPQFS
jgi:hypothetical protein